jgi:hypothetical protein
VFDCRVVQEFYWFVDKVFKSTEETGQDAQ